MTRGEYEQWRTRVARELAGWIAGADRIPRDGKPVWMATEHLLDYAPGGVARITRFEGTDPDAVVRAAHDHRRGVR